MALWHENTFGIIGSLWGESKSHPWFPLTKYIYKISATIYQRTFNNSISKAFKKLNIYIQESAYENVDCKITAILSRFQYVQASLAMILTQFSGNIPTSALVVL